jgi:hypothetical protein
MAWTSTRRRTLSTRRLSGFRLVWFTCICKSHILLVSSMAIKPYEFMDKPNPPTMERTTAHVVRKIGYWHLCPVAVIFLYRLQYTVHEYAGEGLR